MVGDGWVKRGCCKSSLLTRTSYLYNELRNLLFEVFKDYSRYFAILNVIAEGASTFSE